MYEINFKNPEFAPFLFSRYTVLILSYIDENLNLAPLKKFMFIFNKELKIRFSVEYLGVCHYSVGIKISVHRMGGFIS